MRFGGFVWSLIPSLLVSLPLTSAQAADQIDCPDTSLTSYLVAIIDLLYSNGLTTYEQLLASLSESDSGYQLLQSWYSDQTITLLVPTDSAFQAAGIAPPFDTLGEEEITDLVALHTLVGTWSYDHLPGTPEHGIASTFMSVKGHMNVTNVNTNASQVMVMQQGDQSAVTIRMPTGNTTNWGWQIDTSNTELWNVVILPIGEVSTPHRCTTVTPDVIHPNQTPPSFLPHAILYIQYTADPHTDRSIPTKVVRRIDHPHDIPLDIWSTRPCQSARFGRRCTTTRSAD